VPGARRICTRITLQQLSDPNEHGRREPAVFYFAFHADLLRWIYLPVRAVFVAAFVGTIASGGTATPSGPLSSTAVHSCGKSLRTICGFGGRGFGLWPGGKGGGGVFGGAKRASH
jgi:hypothetical protein